MGPGEQRGRVRCWQGEWGTGGSRGAASVTGAAAGPAASGRARLRGCPEEESPAGQVEEGTGDAEAGARQPDSLPEEPQRVSGVLGGGGTAAGGNLPKSGLTQPLVVSTCGSRWEGRASSKSPVPASSTPPDGLQGGLDAGLPRFVAACRRSFLLSGLMVVWRGWSRK